MFVATLLSKSISAIFPTALAHFMCPYNILVILTVFQAFLLLLYVMVICEE